MKNLWKHQSYDDISIRILKLFDNTIVKDLYVLFPNSFQPWFYPDFWENLYEYLFIKRAKPKLTITTVFFISWIFGKVFEKTCL